MRFRKLELFIKSLLAKNVWQIIQYPNSWVAKVLKSRYFKHVDIMKAKIGSNPFFIWRSFLWERDLLEVGRWRIGDVSSVDIFEDRWISSLCLKLDPQNVFLPIGTKVNSLIINRSWNEPWIRSVFLPYVAVKILSIHITHLCG